MKYIKRDTGKSVHLHEELGIDMLQISNTVLSFNQFNELSSLIFQGIIKRMKNIQCKLNLTVEGSEFESIQYGVQKEDERFIFFVGETAVATSEISAMDIFYNLHKELVIKLYYFSSCVKKYVLLRFIPVESVRKQLIAELDEQFGGVSKSNKSPFGKTFRQVFREAQIDAHIKPNPEPKPHRTPVMFRGYWATEPEQVKPNNFELDKDTHIAEALMQ